ncbi:MAG: sec-independent protein translocase protein TatA [Sphingomonadales bacterium]|jgi:sec-independent protein translocase protein TatA|nr:sec-independent protein translocase protein TatA [Sphingomonadales bacterium]
MGSFSIWHWLVVGIVLLLLFGKGRFSEMMGDVAKGIKNFKKGMTEEEEQEAARAAAQRQIDARAAEPTIIQPHPTDIPAEPSASPSVTPAGSSVDGAQR